ncbi:hypothetical protein D9613_012639 [Agrocybe pediades]|uniref:Uncharacterized protein n=1 Tax=Agrocybe pediades TaxID=84607 RepID=A0A8H4QWQ1_9AGAR|nr:hypothetical protein D9613_012639 [Agrocybe pediades]
MSMPTSSSYISAFASLKCLDWTFHHIMSSADGSPLSIAQQTAFITADINSILILQLLFGIYTGLFPATIYAYIHKENRARARDMIVIGSTVMLYGVTAVNVLCNWIYKSTVYCTLGATRLDIFIGSTGGEMIIAEQIILVTTTYVVFLLADSLLVWRCFHSCGRSFRQSLLPIALLVVEIVLVISASVYGCLMTAAPNFGTHQRAQIFDRVSAAAYFSVAATSLTSTGVICVQIWRHTALNTRSRKNYRTVINALVESSALYTVAVLLSAFLNSVVPMDDDISFTLFITSTYVDVTTQIISGLAPTLMIARLFVSSSREDSEFSSAHLPSELIDRATHPNGTNITNVEAALEIQHGVSIGVREDESDEINMVARAEHQCEDGRENGLETLAQ